MYFRCSSHGIAYLLAVSVVGALLLSLLFSCHHGEDQRHEDEIRHAQLDSVMSTITDVDSLDALARQSHEQNDRQSEMLALRHKGDRLRLQSRYNDAIGAHNRCLEIAMDVNDTIEMALALNNLGEDHRRLGEFCEANGYYFNVLKLCDQYSDPESDQMVMVNAMSLYGIGNIEIEMNNYVVADSLLRTALRFQEQLGSNIGMAVNYSALGRIKRDIIENDSAWYYLRKSQEYNQLAGNDKGVALCHLHYGELYESESNFYHAVKEYKIAYDALKALGETWHLLDASLALARVHILLGEEDVAHAYLTEAEVEARRIGSKEFEADAYMIHYQLSLLQGNTKEALDYYVSSNDLKDSIFGNQKSEIMRSQRNEYLNGRMSGEMDVLNRDIDHLKRTNTMQLLFVLSLLLMATGIIGALVYAVRVRARTQRLMRQVEETRSLFFTNVVHQLRTPLSAIMGAIDGIIGDGKNSNITYSAQQQENREIIERQGNNLLMLVDRILEVGNVRSTITELDWRTCDAVTFMHMVLESYRDSCMERHIELTYAPRENSVDIVTVPRYLNTIISSLIENAINYSNEFGKITVTTRVDDGTLVIRVADNGMGISKDDLPHVFEPFYRSAVAESLVEGVGIGLTVVRDMTMAMGGTVAVDSMKDHGSVFTVKLPCYHAYGVKKRFEGNLKELFNVDRDHHRLRGRDELVDETSGVELPVVLVVEDHVDVARLVGLVLGNKYQVHYATDGEQGLAKAIELKPDLIITDVKMPLMDGVEMCRQLRRTARLCHIPVIILSARNADADRVRGIEAGADAYLVKPFVSEELRTWVVNLLENRKRLRAAFATEGAKTEVNDDVPAVLTAGNEDESKFLKSFANEVEKHFTDGTKIDFDKLALFFKMGESQLRHKIQVLTGKNVPAYITQLRMEKAMRLLQTSPADTLIGDIAAQCGIQDVAYFSRVFRQYYGMTPTQARNSGK